MATYASPTAGGVDKPDGGPAESRLSGPFWEPTSSFDADAGDVEVAAPPPPPPRRGPPR